MRSGQITGQQNQFRVGKQLFCFLPMHISSDRHWAHAHVNITERSPSTDIGRIIDQLQYVAIDLCFVRIRFENVGDEDFPRVWGEWCALRDVGHMEKVRDNQILSVLRIFGGEPAEDHWSGDGTLKPGLGHMVDVLFNSCNRCAHAWTTVQIL